CALIPSGCFVGLAERTVGIRRAWFQVASSHTKLNCFRVIPLEIIRSSEMQLCDHVSLADLGCEFEFFSSRTAVPAKEQQVVSIKRVRPQKFRIEINCESSFRNGLIKLPVIEVHPGLNGS